MAGPVYVHLWFVPICCTAEMVPNGADVSPRSSWDTLDDDEDECTALRAVAVEIVVVVLESADAIARDERMNMSRILEVILSLSSLIFCPKCFLKFTGPPGTVPVYTVSTVALVQ